MGIKSIAFVLLFNCTILSALTAANDSITSIDTTVNKPLLRSIAIGTGVLYAGSIFGLYNLWYKDYPQSSFHFINDNHDWLQIDKAGHATAAYNIGVVGFESLRLAGLDNTKAALYGGSLGLIYLTTVEIFDGFSEEWGASSGDVIANFSGSALFISQQLFWKEQRIRMKWSVHQTDFAPMRPDLLGKNTTQRLLKDYNGHTYWLSVNIKSFLKDDSRFPAWLNIAAGYTGSGMLGSTTNPESYNEIPLPHYERQRRYLISPDIDLSKIKVNNKTVNYLLKIFGFIKIPMPALEINSSGIKMHALYF